MKKSIIDRLFPCDKRMCAAVDRHKAAFKELMDVLDRQKDEPKLAVVSRKSESTHGSKL